MKKELKVFVIGGAKHYASWLDNYKLVDNPENANILFFTGGEDVNPRYYGERTGRYTSAPNQNRDKIEKSYFDIFKNKFKIGVCRGSQFLNVMNGGKLIQHVTNHAIAGTHLIETSDNKSFNVTSTHHQMCIPARTKYFELLGWANKLSTTYLNGHNEEKTLPNNYREFEIGYYPRTKSLLIQSHPEMMDSGNEFHKYLNQLVEEKMNSEQKVSSLNIKVPYIKNEDAFDDIDIERENDM